MYIYIYIQVRNGSLNSIDLFAIKNYTFEIIILLTTTFILGKAHEVITFYTVIKANNKIKI
jgi:hypothetical protein